MVIIRLVALFTRAWIEIDYKSRNPEYPTVALFTRAWIEMNQIMKNLGMAQGSPSLRGRGLKSRGTQFAKGEKGRPLYEGVD